ncbi:MAG: ATP-binding protein [Planctomycetota bacterium]|jgi:anti-sigma regulatory factor (Ser/Thr protein kinase)
MGEVLKEQLVVGSHTKNLMQVRDFVRGLVRRSRLAVEEENKVILAVDEAVSNIIEHGYSEGGGPGGIEIEVEADDEQFKIRIRDTGTVFDPEAVQEPDIVRASAGTRKRGLGIFLMRQVMDEVRYRFQEGLKNELTLVKYIR